jgi:hypothetical protein
MAYAAVELAVGKLDHGANLDKFLPHLFRVAVQAFIGG